jgi:hypothetical protein
MNRSVIEKQWLMIKYLHGQVLPWQFLQPRKPLGLPKNGVRLV